MAHIGTERIGDGDAAVLLLVILDHGDQTAADSDAGAVEGVDELRFGLRRWPVARIHAAGLEGAAHRAAGDFAESVLAGQPGLDIVSALGAEAHIACAEYDGTVWDFQSF